MRAGLSTRRQELTLDVGNCIVCVSILDGRGSTESFDTLTRELPYAVLRSCVGFHLLVLLRFEPKFAALRVILRGSSELKQVKQA